MADVSWSQMLRGLVKVFAVLSMAYTMEGGGVEITCYEGDNITLNCYRSGSINDNYQKWNKNGALIANEKGVLIDDPRYTQRNTYEYQGSYYRDTNILYIANIRTFDSAIITCINYYDTVYWSYEILVIGCSRCLSTSHYDQTKTKVICSLENYRTEISDISSRVQLYYNNGSYIYHNTLIIENGFSFSVYKTDLVKFHSDFYLHVYIEEDSEKRITCTLPPPPTTTSSYSTAQQTTQSIPLILPSTVGVPAERVTSTSMSTKYNTPKNTDSSSDEITKDANMTIIIVALGSVFILILVIIIVALRCRQTKNRQDDSKHNDKASIKKDHPGDYYESVEEGRNKGPEYATSIKELKDTSVERGVDHPEHGEMVENILYDSREQITDSSIPRMEGPLDNALYALPDKRATIGRETKTIHRETTSIGPDRSSDSNLLYGNSDIITQHQPNKDTLRHQTDQYENVDLPGSGGTEEIPLYEMPDKGPIGNASKDTPKARQTSTLSRDDRVNVDALYAEVDKSKKK